MTHVQILADTPQRIARHMPLIATADATVIDAGNGRVEIRTASGRRDDAIVLAALLARRAAAATSSRLDGIQAA